MALSAWQATIVNESGDVIPSASIEVINETTGLTATIYANAGGGSLGNPFSAGTNGFARFYADAGSYTITASDAGSGFSESFNNVRLGNAQGYEVGAGAGQIPRNSDLPTFGSAAEVDTGPGAADVPTNANLSTSIAGTTTFSGDVYTFSPAGTGFRQLQAGMYLSFRLPSGSANTTTTPDISYNGTTYVIKWIDGSALEADDLDQTYNKQPVLFYFDGTDMLLASDIGGAGWNRKTDGYQICENVRTVNEAITVASGNVFSLSSPISGYTYPKAFSSAPSASVFASCPTNGLFWVCGSTDIGSNTTSPDFQLADSQSVSARNYTVFEKSTGRWY